MRSNHTSREIYQSVQSQAGYDIPFKPLKPAHQETKCTAAAPLRFHSGPHYTSRSETQSLAEIRGREPEFVIRCQRASRCGAEYTVEPRLIHLPGQCFSSRKLQRQASLIFIITSLLLHAQTHIGSLAGFTDTFAVRLALLFPVFRFLHL